MSSGISTANLPRAASLLDVLGNEDVGGGVPRTARLPLDALAKLVSASAVQITAPTLAALNALLNYPANTGAQVVADTDVTKRGIYIKVGASGTGSWTKIADLPAGAAGRDAGLYPGGRPGDAPTLFTTDTAVRDPLAYASLDAAKVTTTAQGKTYPLEGAGFVLTKGFQAIDPTEVYRFKASFTRETAPASATGDTIRAGLLCYNGAGTQIGDVVAMAWSAPAVGAQMAYEGLFSGTDTGQPGVTVLPTGTRSVRPHLRAFGGAQKTNVEFIDWTGTGALGATAAALAVTGDVRDALRFVDTPDGLAIADPYGFVAALFNGEGFHLSDASFGRVDGFAYAVADPFGFVGLALTTGGRLIAGGLDTGGSTAAYSGSELSERNARALALSGAIRDGSNAQIAAPVWGYTHLLWYGQSLGVGTEAYPAKSKTPRSDVLMLGDSVRPLSEQTTTYDVVGSAVLKPLRATVQPGGAGGAPLTDAQVAALGPDNQAAGESPAEGASRFARKLFLQQHGLQTDPSRLLVVSNASSGGRSIEDLSKGASPELFNRLRSTVAQVRAAVAPSGKSYGIGAIFFLQGEANYAGVRGSTTTLAGYKALLGKLYDDFLADVVAGINQADPPPIITYQTSGTWVNDTLSIGQAQFELTLERQGWYLAAPSYSVTDKSGHLDPNGSRWLGLQMGKVYHEVAVRRRGWRPTSPLQATFRGNTVLIDMHAPVPPLQFRPVYVKSEAVTYVNKGFTVVDDAGEAGITSVTIVRDTLVQIVCSRALTGTVRAFYGRRTGYLGGGNLCDSDLTIAPDVYEYSAGSGDYAEANIPELVGKPYPLQNWSINFVITATAD